MYCKKCKKEGSLVAEMETAGNNLHIDFYVQHDNQRGTTHFVGRIFRSLKRREEARGESFGGVSPPRAEGGLRKAFKQNFQLIKV